MIINKIMNNNKKLNLKTYIFLFTLTFITFFTKFYLFGAYEDDLSQLRYFGTSFNEKINLISNYIANFPMGRPFGFISLRVLSSFLYDIGGVNLLYLFCCFILSSNSFLVFLILRKININYSLAIIGSLIFITFPGDALKMTIVRGFQVHLSILICLLATLLYLKNKKLTSYILFFVSLLTYENGIFIFLFASALKHKSLNIKNNFKHVLFIAITIIFVILIRKYIGSGNRLDGMMGNISDLEKLLRIPISIIGGLFMSFVSYIKKPIHLILNFKIWMLLVTLIVLFTFYYLEKIKNFITYQEDIKKQEALNLFFIGIFSISLGYIVMSNHRFGAIWTEYGRITSTHSQSAFGISLCFVIIINALSNLLNKRKKKFIITFFLTFLIAPGVIFGNFIQNKIITSWEKNKKLYSFIDKEVLDWKDGLVLLIPDHFNNNKYVLGTAWNSFYTPQLIYKFPSTWKQKPIIISKNRLNLENEQLFYIKLGKKIKIDKKNIILINYKQNKFYRNKNRQIKLKINEEKFLINSYVGKNFKADKNIMYDFFIY